MSQINSEKSIIKMILRTATSRAQGLDVGIGDDCAVYRFGNGRSRLLLSTDLLQEGVHFVRSWTTPFLLGFKSLAVNISDIAAMGGKPLGYVICLSLPKDVSQKYVEQFYKGLQQAGSRFGVTLAGGDLVGSPSGIIISIAIFGKIDSRPVLRSGAQPTDYICVSGRLGISAIGLELIRKGYRPLRAIERVVRQGLCEPQPQTESQWRQMCVLAHLAPTPDIKLASALQAAQVVSSMMDLSDGLALDLSRICEASGVGALLQEEKLPRCPRLLLNAELQRECLLHGGEDYSLIFTVPQQHWKKLQTILRNHPASQVSRIGEVISRRRALLLSTAGVVRNLPQRGYDHFAIRQDSISWKCL